MILRPRRNPQQSFASGAGNERPNEQPHRRVTFETSTMEDGEADGNGVFTYDG